MFGTAIGALAVCALLPFWPSGKIDAVKFEAIRVGMSRGEVEAILGRPPDISGVNLARKSMAVWTDFFCGEAIGLDFDANGSVQQKQFISADHFGIRVALLIKRFQARSLWR